MSGSNALSVGIDSALHRPTEVTREFRIIDEHETVYKHGITFQSISFCGFNRSATHLSLLPSPKACSNCAAFL